MHRASNSARFRSPDGLKSSIFKAIRNVGSEKTASKMFPFVVETNIEDESENIQCPFAKIDDELEIGDFRIFANSEINEAEKPIQKLQEKNQNENEMWILVLTKHSFG
uniref:Uncharacterized protein n=1 Tax=Elaeophora elaphi TaxID=1147741 RepID=A0A0R3RNG2_9BILA